MIITHYFKKNNIFRLYHKKFYENFLFFGVVRTGNGIFIVLSESPFYEKTKRFSESYFYRIKRFIFPKKISKNKLHIFAKYGKMCVCDWFTQSFGKEKSTPSRTAERRPLCTSITTPFNPINWRKSLRFVPKARPTHRKPSIISNPA